MKVKFSIVLFFLLLSFCHHSFAQDPKTIDSLQLIVNQEKGDTTELNALIELAMQTEDWIPAKKYANRGLLLAQKLKDEHKEADCQFLVGDREPDGVLRIQGLTAALNIYERIGDNTGASLTRLLMQDQYREEGDYKTSLYFAFAGLKLAEKFHVLGRLGVFPGLRLAPLFLAEIGQTYILMKQLDSALYYTKQSIEQHEQFNGSEWNFPIYLLAYIQNKQGKYPEALSNYRIAKPLAIKNDFPRDTTQIYSGMSTLFVNMGQLDSAAHYARMVTESWNPDSSEKKNMLEAIQSLQDVYRKTKNKDSLLKYVEWKQSLNDSFYSREKDREIQNILFNDRMNKEELLSDQEKYKSRIQLFGLATGLLALLIIVFLLWRSNQNKQKSNIKIEKAYTELKATQTRLLQSEKMASLGELTAGIAHEIQNPLNFVNNFSEVNRELLEEMREAADQGDLVAVREITGDIIDNEEKINHHGKRADAIVKSMLQHSRINAGIKEPTDVNSLADEYLRLAYHGLRAQDKTFNADLQTNFDDSIGNINIVPQDIGRVFLNLYNNAFYDVSKKKSQHPANYKPVVSVTTVKKFNTVEINIKDNGNGIPVNVMDKIFQPFFTTKPPGSGTGLGLSLSYDIIRSHGGEIKVKSQEGLGSEFIIELPVG
jgi:two-component system, NtrC family, sensor kinase